jgi:hypothetical protein
MVGSPCVGDNGRGQGKSRLRPLATESGGGARLIRLFIELNETVTFERAGGNSRTEKKSGLRAGWRGRVGVDGWNGCAGTVDFPITARLLLDILLDRIAIAGRAGWHAARGGLTL